MVVIEFKPGLGLPRAYREDSPGSAFKLKISAGFVNLKSRRVNFEKRTRSLFYKGQREIGIVVTPTFYPKIS